MRWRGRAESGNVEDERGSGGSGGGFGGFGGGGIRLGGGATILIIIISLILGKNPLSLLNAVQGGQADGQPNQEQPLAPAQNTEDDSAAHFVAVVLETTEQVWAKQFAAMGKTYRKPILRLFRGQTQSGCGGASAASGPFYCPADERLYIDLSFYDELKSRFGAPGDFAMAYVVAHEIGHHVQNLLGTSAKLDAARGQVPEAEYNKLSVRLELQADFYAGIWAHDADKDLHVDRKSVV